MIESGVLPTAAIPRQSKLQEPYEAALASLDLTFRSINWLDAMLALRKERSSGWCPKSSSTADFIPLPMRNDSIF